MFTCKRQKLGVRLFITKNMRFVLRLFIALFIIFSYANGNSQTPDTINIETTLVKGFGPFEFSVSPIQTMGKTNPWKNTIPKINGVPKDTILFVVEYADFRQHVIQSYKSGTLDPEFLKQVKNAWAWEPISSDYYSETINNAIAISASFDESGKLKLLVDTNNNYDLSDEKPKSLPAFKPGQSYWGRYNDDLPFQVEHEIFTNGKKEKQTAWMFIDFDRSMEDVEIDKNSKLILVYNFAQHRIGEFEYNGKNYLFAMRSDNIAFRNSFEMKIYPKGAKSSIVNAQKGFSPNGLSRLEDNYFRLKSVSVDGKWVTLQKDGKANEIGGNGINEKAINILEFDINGNPIDLSKLRGKYVLLDFWGTWCSPCVEEIPKFKIIFSEYKNKGFTIIGIAKDNKEVLNDFIKLNKIEWPQIVQDENYNLISSYGILRYPTTFLIDPNGNIIDKDIRAEQLREKLDSLLKK